MPNPLHSRNPIHLAVVTDQDFAMPLGAMLASLVARLDPDRSLVIHAVVDRLPESAWEKLVGSVPPGRAEWHRFAMNAGELVRRGFRTRSYGHIPPVTYLRLLLPELLPEAVDKVLYLDGDLLVREDIAPLWETDLTGFDLAAAPECDRAGRVLPVRRGIRHYRALGMRPELPVFNVGVMLINLRRWRDEQVAGRAFVYLRCLGPEIRWYEQDALNVVSHGRHRSLPMRWNVRPPFRDAAGTVPAIVHFLRTTKPWHWNYAGAYREEFFAALDRTPWAGWRPARPRLGRTRLLLARLPRAVLKSLDAARRPGGSLTRRLRYRWGEPAQPIPIGTAGPAPRRRGEIRLFLVIASREPGLARILEACGAAGVDRAFVLDRSGGRATDGLSGSRLPVHVFGCDPGRSAQGLRRLLDRYGTGHWCVLGDPVAVLGGDPGRPLPLPALCARLEEEGADLLEAHTAPDRAIELVGRDLRTGRLFRSTAVARFPLQAWDPPVFGSRPVLLKYRRNMRLDAAMVLAGNVTRSVRSLRLSPADAGAPL